MKESPNRSHYRGLLAQWYDRLLEVEEEDIEFYQKIALESDGPVLELACGTGRLLVPYRELGVDIDGVDVAGDMLEICQRKLEAAGLEADLYQQPIEELDLPRQYPTIFISGGSFQLVDDFGQAMQALQVINDHLLPGGQFVLDLFIPWDEIIAHQDDLWRLTRTARKENGQELLCYGCATFDLREQIKMGVYKYELYQDKQLVETVVGELRLRWYGRHEFALMLEKSGFTNIRTERKDLISRHIDALVYYARKE